MDREQEIAKIAEPIESRLKSIVTLTRSPHWIWENEDREITQHAYYAAKDIYEASFVSPVDGELELTDDKILAIWQENIFENGMVTDFAKKIIAKATPIIKAQQDAELRDEIDKARIEIAEISKELDDREADLIEAKAEVAREILGKMNMRDVGGVNPEWALSDKQYKDFESHCLPEGEE